MKVAIVTPYYRETDDVLRACLESVRDQTHAPCQHFLVADGFPNPLVDEYATTHIRLPHAHGDNGNLGRCLGAFAAISEGFDAIAFLDADNWFRADHIAHMVALQARTGVAVCTSGRSIHRLDGSLLLAHDSESDGAQFTDTSCLVIFRPAFDLMALWGSMPREAGPICDRIMWDAIRLRGITRAHDPEPSVGFRSQYAFHYAKAGEAIPANAKTGTDQKIANAHVMAQPFVHRIGMLLGLGGAEDLSALAAAQPGNAAATQPVTLQGNGRSLILHMPDDEGIRFVLREIFNEQQYRPVPGLPAPRAVLDIGANIGLAAAYFRLVYPDAAIVCVEPDPNAHALLARNAAVIGNCQAICAGLSQGTHIRPFHLAASSVLSSTAAASSHAARLLLIDAENLVVNLARQDFDIIKIDTEGAEIAIMLSLRQRLASTTTILLEFHSDSDRRVMDALLSTTHFLWHATVTSPHRGTLCYVHRAQAQNILPDRALT